MAHTYRLVGWNRQKRIYDLTLLAGILVYLAVFATVALITHPQITLETLLIRGLGTLAFLLLNVVLSIGPLARLSPRLLPLLYNRRHLGVATFIVGLAHALISLIQFHGWGVLSPWVSLLVSNGSYSDLAFFPFQLLGLAALAVLFLMAATSHDFWLNVLNPRIWKSLHMAVYVAYVLLVGHIALGVLQAESNPILTVVLGASVVWISGLHLIAGWREQVHDRAGASVPPDTTEQVPWVDAGVASEIADGRAKVVLAGNERVAIFRNGNQLVALGNVCAHQGGPLGEGRVVNNCAVCPWHGYEYQLETGTSPPPFTESVPVYRLRLSQGRLQIDPRPQPAGTRPTCLEAKATDPDQSPFYVGYQAKAPQVIARSLSLASIGLFAISALLAAGLATWQEPFDRGVFEFGVETTVVGTLLSDPIPHLWVEPGVDSGKGAPVAPGGYLLVELGKYGFSSQRTSPGRVRVIGSLIRSEAGKMIEVHSIEPIPSETLSIALQPTAAPSVPSLQDLGSQTLRGEIVDAKCYYGVMKPGRKKPHRACASLCIRGGIPAVLLSQQRNSRRAVILVPNGEEPIGSELLSRIAEPVQVEGIVQQRGDLQFLRLDTMAIRRLHSAFEKP